MSVRLQLKACSLAALLCGLSAMPEARAQAPLTAAERERAVELTRSASAPGPTTRTLGAGGDGGKLVDLADTPAGRERRNEVTAVVPLEAPPDDKGTRSLTGGPRRAIVTRFDYATGAVVTTTVDLGSGEILGSEAEVNLTTPLSERELADAQALLADKVPEVAELTRNGWSGIGFTHLVSMVQHPTLPRFGHRLLTIRIQKPRRTALYLVDLTMREVVRQAN